MKTTKIPNSKAISRLHAAATAAEKQVEAARKRARLAKAQFKQARKALKQAKKAAKQARKQAKAAAKAMKAKARTPTKAQAKAEKGARVRRVGAGPAAAKPASLTTAPMLVTSKTEPPASAASAIALPA